MANSIDPDLMPCHAVFDLHVFFFFQASLLECYESHQALSEYLGSNKYPQHVLTLLLLNTTCPVLANSVDPDQLASSEANWSGSALFVIKCVNFYQKPRSSNLIGWKLEVGVAS